MRRRCKPASLRRLSGAMDGSKPTTSADREVGLTRQHVDTGRSGGPLAPRCAMGPSMGLPTDTGDVTQPALPTVRHREVSAAVMASTYSSTSSSVVSKAVIHRTSLVGAFQS